MFVNVRQGCGIFTEQKAPVLTLSLYLGTIAPRLLNQKAASSFSRRPQLRPPRPVPRDSSHEVREAHFAVEDTEAPAGRAASSRPRGWKRQR